MVAGPSQLTNSRPPISKRFPEKVFVKAQGKGAAKRGLLSRLKDKPRFSSAQMDSRNTFIINE